MSACVLFMLTSRLPLRVGRGSWTAVKVSSGLGECSASGALFREAAGLAGDSGAQSSLAALDAPWT